MASLYTSWWNLVNRNPIPGNNFVNYASRSNVPSIPLCLFHYEPLIIRKCCIMLSLFITVCLHIFRWYRDERLWWRRLLTRNEVLRRRAKLCESGYILEGHNSRYGCSARSPFYDRRSYSSSGQLSTISTTPLWLYFF